MSGKSIGARVLRSEDARLLTGNGEFVDDIQLPDMLHAAFVRSAHAHAKIRGIDVAAARAMAGVHLVLTFGDLPEPLRACYGGGFGLAEQCVYANFVALCG